MTEDAGMPKRYYPSGRPMPTYGPSTDDEQILDALEWAHDMLLSRDQMNASIHCTIARPSPVTLKVGAALGIMYTRVPAIGDWSVDGDKQ